MWIFIAVDKRKCLCNTNYFYWHNFLMASLTIFHLFSLPDLQAGVRDWATRRRLTWLYNTLDKFLGVLLFSQAFLHRLARDNCLLFAYEFEKNNKACWGGTFLNRQPLTSQSNTFKFFFSISALKTISSSGDNCYRSVKECDRCGESESNCNSVYGQCVYPIPMDLNSWQK